MKARLFAMVVFGVAAICLLSNANGQQSPAASGPGSIQEQIKAARVRETVMVIHAQGISVALHDKDSLVQGDIVTTALKSSVVLVFSNGSTVSIGPESRVAIDEFTQDPFAADVKLSEIKEQPSKSTTKLTMTYGELVGNVKHLTGKSTFIVETPVGAAGIRGTTFRLVYRPTGNGQAFFSLSTASGTVFFTGSTGAPITVGANQEVDIKVTIDPTTGAVSVQVTSTGISEEAREAIEQQVKDAIEALGATTFVSLGVQSGNGDQGQGQQQPPQTTPGDGQSS